MLNVTPPTFIKQNASKTWQSIFCLTKGQEKVKQNNDWRFGRLKFPKSTRFRKDGATESKTLKNFARRF